MQSYLTVQIPGTGGVIKETPGDFLVTEIPAYEPSGSGEHIYLTIEKKGMTTLEAIRRVARELRVPERDIGYAGMKDSIGVTQQTLSVQRVRPEDVIGRNLDGVIVLAARRHGNKLKLGHLKGNRFRIAVRGTVPDAVSRTAMVLSILQSRGVPNWFGYQRYGAQGNSHLIGAAMVRRDWRSAVDRLIGESEAIRDTQWQSAIEAYRENDLAAAFHLMPRHCRSERDILQRLVSRPDAWEKAFGAVHPRMKKLYLSAYQSSLFDRVVEQRLAGLDRVVAGDIACKHVNGACFLVENQAVEQERADTFEISATGPMFGTKMMQAGGTVRKIEEEILTAEDITAESFDLGNGLRVEGERRPLRVPLSDSSFSLDGDVLTVEFTLPKGSYATSVMREITKSF